MIPSEVRWDVTIPSSNALTFENERCIEIPLGMEAAELHAPGWVLDAGCGINRHLQSPGQASLLHLTQNLISEKASLYAGKRSYVNADLRNLRLFASRAFDRTVCVSTLEHVGFDNTTYGGAVENDPDSMFVALHELCRVTKRRLLITVPFNVEKHACEQWRYITREDLEAMAALVNVYDFTAEFKFYGRLPNRQWYGGSTSPVEADRTDFPTKVNAFVAMRCTRE